MDRIFVVLKNRYPGCIFIYMDDILIMTSDDEELHAEIVNTVLVSWFQGTVARSELS